MGMLFLDSMLMIMCESHSVMSNSLQPHGLYSPWNSPGQNNGVDSLSLLQGSLSNPGIKPRSPAVQADSLPAEPQGKLCMWSISYEMLGWMNHKLESRLLGETATASDTQIIPC